MSSTINGEERNDRCHDLEHPSTISLSNTRLYDSRSENVHQNVFVLNWSQNGGKTQYCIFWITKCSRKNAHASNSNLLNEFTLGVGERIRMEEKKHLTFHVCERFCVMWYDHYLRCRRNNLHWTARSDKDVDSSQLFPQNMRITISHTMQVIIIAYYRYYGCILWTRSHIESNRWINEVKRGNPPDEKVLLKRASERKNILLLQ